MQKKPNIHNLIQNIPFILSGMAVAMLNTTSMSRFFLAVIMSIVLIITSMYLNQIYKYWKANISVFSFSISFCMLVVFGCSFYSRMTSSIKLQKLGTSLGINITAIIILCVLLGIVAGIYFLSTVISAVYSIVSLNTQKEQDSQLSANQTTAISVKQLIFILITAISAITICSKSSPIYPFNDWVDANCFMTVGKSMLHGLVPYRDLYEQKGPLLYMLHALAAMFSETTFIGVYFLEIIAATGFLFYSFKTIKLYQQSTSILLIPILAAVVYSTSSFCQGDSAEEFCLPLLTFAIYLAVKMIKQEKSLMWWEFMAVGVTSAFVLWIKFSMLGFYLGWFFVIIWQLMKRKAVSPPPQALLCGLVQAFSYQQYLF